MEVLQEYCLEIAFGKDATDLSCRTEGLQAAYEEEIMACAPV
jgi:hypothetical protein